MKHEDEMTRASVDGRKAAELGKAHTTNPYLWRNDYLLHLTWFEAWFIRRIEIDDNCKIQRNEDQP